VGYLDRVFFQQFIHHTFFLDAGQVVFELALHILPHFRAQFLHVAVYHTQSFGQLTINGG
jgi:hypothetical protein